MKRRVFAVFGALLLLGEAAFLGAFGLPLLDFRTAILLALPACCGVLFVLGGFSMGGERIAWNQFIGVGDILIGIWLGVSLSLSAMSDPTLGDGGLIFVAVAVISGLIMVFIGMVWLYDGDGFGIDRYEPGPLFN